MWGQTILPITFTLANLLTLTSNILTKLTLNICSLNSEKILHYWTVSTPLGQTDMCQFNHGPPPHPQHDPSGLNHKPKYSMLLSMTPKFDSQAAKHV